VENFGITDGPIDEHTHVIEPHGEIDLSTAGELEERASAVLALDKRCVIVDLEDVGFMDSTGIGVLVSLQRELEERDGSLIVACPDPAVARVFEITGLTESLNVQTSRRDALVQAEALGAATAG
jgi:anti-anti-sigma factor